MIEEFNGVFLIERDCVYARAVSKKAHLKKEVLITDNSIHTYLTQSLKFLAQQHNDDCFGHWAVKIPTIH